MYFLALATDYDGTLAHDGVVDPDTVAAIRRLKNSGRRLILVTGRELPDLQRAFPELAGCDLIVAENGALLYEPGTGRETVLAPAPPEAFVARLRERGVHPLSVGRSIVASWEPMQDIVLETIRELGLELQIVFNKGAVMVLPSGVNKASGLAAALVESGLSPHNVVGIGDAENDHAFLAMCGCSVAVANALDSVKSEADMVTRGARGDGVRELIEQLLASDLAEVVQTSARHRVPLSDAAEGDGFFLRPNGGNLLVAGISGGGKSTMVTGVLERLAESGFQFCVIDPEGDYSELEGAVVLGDARQQPRIPELLEILRRPDSNAVVNMLDVDLADRPTFFDGLLTRLSELRAQTGRPHWIVVDEAHHLVPASRHAARHDPAARAARHDPGNGPPRPAGARGPRHRRDGGRGRRCPREHHSALLCGPWRRAAAAAKRRSDRGRRSPPVGAQLRSRAGSGPGRSAAAAAPAPCPQIHRG